MRNAKSFGHSYTCSDCGHTETLSFYPDCCSVCRCVMSPSVEAAAYYAELEEKHFAAMDAAYEREVA